MMKTMNPEIEKHTTRAYITESVMAFTVKKLMRESGVLYGLSGQNIGMHVKDTYTAEKTPIAETIER